MPLEERIHVGKELAGHFISAEESEAVLLVSVDPVLHFFARSLEFMNDNLIDQCVNLDVSKGLIALGNKDGTLDSSDLFGYIRVSQMV